MSPLTVNTLKIFSPAAYYDVINIRSRLSLMVDVKHFHIDAILVLSHQTLRRHSVGVNLYISL